MQSSTKRRWNFAAIGKLTKRNRDAGHGKRDGTRLVSGLAAALGGNAFRLAIKHGWAEAS